LLNLVGFSKDDSKFVENFALLIEIRRHLKNSYKSADSMIIGFELLIENTDTIPKLRVLNVLKRVESVLISIKRFLKIFNQEVAVT